MKKLITICAVATMILAANNLARAATVNIYSSPAPNKYFATSSFSAWWSNAQQAIYTGVTTYGTGNAQYNQISVTGGQSDLRPAYEAAVSGFDSWHGVAGSTGECGTRMHFCYHIEATGTESLSLSKIADIEIFEDGFGHTNYGIFENMYGSAFSFDANTPFEPSKRVGYTVDGTVVTSGTVEAWDAANVGNEITDIIGTYGMACDVYNPSGVYAGTTDQELLDSCIADVYNNLNAWTAELTYDGVTVETTANIVPEPSTLALLAFGGLTALAAAWIRKRRVK